MALELEHVAHLAVIEPCVSWRSSSSSMAIPFLTRSALLRVGEGLVEVDRSVDCSREWCPSTDVNGHTGGAGGCRFDSKGGAHAQ